MTLFLAILTFIVLVTLKAAAVIDISMMTTFGPLIVWITAALVVIIEGLFWKIVRGHLPGGGN